MTTDPAPTPEPQVQPSSTPDGPQVIPTHGTPEGEPGPDPDAERARAMADQARADLHAAKPAGDTGSVPFDVRESDPNAGGPHGLGGGMGVSSERTGPDGEERR